MRDLALPPRFDLVVGLDLSEASDMVLQRAFEQASTRDCPTLHVLGVLPTQRSSWWRARRATLGGQRTDLRRQLAERVRLALEDGVPDDAARAGWMVRIHVVAGAIDEQVAEYATDLGASMIVVPRSGASTDRLVTRAACPVLVVSLPADAAARAPSCHDCADVRSWSQGEQWFCERHHGEWIGHAALLSLH